MFPLMAFDHSKWTFVRQSAPLKVPPTKRPLPLGAGPTRSGSPQQKGHEKETQNVLQESHHPHRILQPQEANKVFESALPGSIKKRKPGSLVVGAKAVIPLEESPSISLRRNSQPAKSIADV